MWLADSNVGGVTAGLALHNSSNVGQLRHSLEWEREGNEVDSHFRALHNTHTCHIEPRHLKQ